MYILGLIVTFTAIAAGAVPRLPLRSFEIVGGEPTDISKHPWQIGIEFTLGFMCGGFLISDSWALTAAHCTKLFHAKNIRAGTSIVETGGEVIPIEEFIKHPNFNLTTHDNDICLIKLSRSVTTHNASAATLPASGEAIEDGTLSTLVGWGSTEQDGNISEQLLQVQVPIVNHDICNKAYGGNKITENMFCAGLLGVGGKDTCQGDSGGPVEVDGKVIGIVSWGHGCAQPDYPGVYTKVSNYIDWIKNTTGLNL